MKLKNNYISFNIFALLILAQGYTNSINAMSSFYKKITTSPLYGPTTSAFNFGREKLWNSFYTANKTVPQYLGNITHNFLKGSAKALEYEPSWFSSLPNPKNPFIEWGTGQIVLPVLLYTAGWYIANKTKIKSKINDVKNIYSGEIKAKIKTIKDTMNLHNKLDQIRIDEDDLPEGTEKEIATKENTKNLLSLDKIRANIGNELWLADNLDTLSKSTRLRVLNTNKTEENLLPYIYKTQAYLKALLENFPKYDNSNKALSDLDAKIITIFAANTKNAIFYRWRTSLGQIFPSIINLASATIGNPALVKAQSLYYLIPSLKRVWQLSNKKVADITNNDVYIFRSDLENIIYFWTHSLLEALHFHAKTAFKL